MNDYIKTYGEPGETKIRTHLAMPGQDYTLCGLDSAGDELVHDKPPEYLPKGRRYRVTCETCQAIILTVKTHLLPKHE